MSRKYESQCVDCGLPCLGSACRYYRVAVDYCDSCGDENAEYVIDGEDYCEECAKEYIKDAFDDLTLSKQAELLNIDMRRID